LSTVGGKRIGRALCLGVDAEDGARTFAGIAAQSGFRSPTLLLGERATLAAVCSHLEDAASVSEPGDIFLLTFSGHGGRTKRRSTAGDVVEVGAWHLSDGVLDDQHLQSQLAHFKPGVRVLVVSDNCNGGIPSPRPHEASPSLNASVLVLAACQSYQYADASGLPGHFTEVVKRTWDRGSFQGAYPQFHQALCGGMPSYQTPDFYRAGAEDDAFEAQRPFTI
jgi:hypothetical protein